MDWVHGVRLGPPGDLYVCADFTVRLKTRDSLRTCLDFGVTDLYNISSIISIYIHVYKYT